MKRGVSAESPIASRRRLTALFNPWSKSTNVSPGRTVQQHRQDLKGLVVQLDPGSSLTQFSRAQIYFEDSKLHHTQGSRRGRHDGITPVRAQAYYVLEDLSSHILLWTWRPTCLCISKLRREKHWSPLELTPIVSRAKLCATWRADVTLH